MPTMNYSNADALYFNADINPGDRFRSKGNMSESSPLFRFTPSQNNILNIIHCRIHPSSIWDVKTRGSCSDPVSFVGSDERREK